MITNLAHAWGWNVRNTKFDPFPVTVHHRPYQTLTLFCLPPLGIEHTHQIELYLGLYYHLCTSSPAYPLERRAIKTITCSVHTSRRASFAQKHIDSGGLYNDQRPNCAGTPINLTSSFSLLFRSQRLTTYHFQETCLSVTKSVLAPPSSYREQPLQNTEHFIGDFRDRCR